MPNPSKQCILVNLEISTFEQFDDLVFENLKVLKLWIFEALELWNFESVKL